MENVKINMHFIEEDFHNEIYFNSRMFKQKQTVSNRKAIDRNWRNHKAISALKTKTGNKYNK